ncbi:MAG: class II aldolase/adducin family protein [Candidatus Bathyarchaeota archaeon]|nr:class II aldolase/adducin family protein [Candidatus Bathyarchaeota archaeon]
MVGSTGTSRDDIQEKLIQSCKILHREVPSVHNPNPMGHFSAKIPGTDEVIIKPRDVGWNKVTPDDLITYTLDYQKLSGPDYEIVELPIHLEMYRHRKDVMAVVHTHQNYATLMGTLGLKLELLDPSTLAFTDGIPTYDEVDDPSYFSKEVGTLIRNETQGRIAAKKIGSSSALIMKAHGPIIVGRSVEAACMLTISLENAAKSQITASMIGGKRAPIDSLGLAPRQPSVNLWKALLNSY